MRIGFLGVGRIGASHAAVDRHEAVTSLVVADADPAGARLSPTSWEQRA